MQQTYSRHQQGIGFIGLIMSIALLISAVFVGFKVAPVLFEQQKVRFAQESVAAQLGVEEKSRSELIQELKKRLVLDDVDGVDGRHITIANKGDFLEIRIRYERQIQILDQLDFVIQYDKTVSTAD